MLGPEVAAAIRDAAADRADLVVNLRRRLHRIPELGFEERETTGLVAVFLEERRIRFEPCAWGTGGVAVLGESGAPGVVLRADLDALPIEEEVDAPFRSQRPGRMHACGHDAHAAMLLAAADALASGAVPLPPKAGPVVCVFQPAEEGGGGCLRMIRDGLLGRHPAHASVALHVWPDLRTGSVGVGPGPLMASMDRIRLRFRGRGGHGAYPHACVDPVVMASEAVLALQTVVSRGLDPLEPGVFTIGSVHGGSAPNVIPDCVELDGTVRACSPEARTTLLRGIERTASGVAAAYGGSVEISMEEGYPVTRNDPEAAGLLAGGIASVLGPDAVVPARRTMGSEDMGFLLERVAGCYLQLGASAEPERAAPLHSSHFELDEACLTVGVAALLAAVWVLGAAAGEREA